MKQKTLLVAITLTAMLTAHGMKKEGEPCGIPTLIELCQKKLSHPNALATLARQPGIATKKYPIDNLKITHNIERLLAKATRKGYVAEGFIDYVIAHPQKPLIAYAVKTSEDDQANSKLKFGELSRNAKITFRNHHTEMEKLIIACWANKKTSLATIAKEDNNETLAVIELSETTDSLSIKRLASHATNATALSWSHDDNFLAVACHNTNQILHVHDLKNNSVLSYIQEEKTKRILWQKDNNLLYLLTTAGSLWYVALNSENKTLGKIKINVPILDIDIMHTGKIAAVLKGDSANSLIIFDDQTAAIRLQKSVSCLACNPKQFKPAWVSDKNSIMRTYMFNKNIQKIVTFYPDKEATYPPIEKLSWNQSGSDLIAIDDTNNVYVQNIHEDSLERFSKSVNNQNCITWHPHDTHLYLGRKNILWILPRPKAFEWDERQLTLAQAALICAATQEKDKIILCEHNQEPAHLWEIYTQTEWSPKIKKYLDSYMKKECELCT